ncbi:MAG: hypothetical protein EOP49_47505, partial [Sphingobacteriales bacterium]
MEKVLFGLWDKASASRSHFTLPNAAVMLVAYVASNSKPKVFAAVREFSTELCPGADFTKGAFELSLVSESDTNIQMLDAGASFVTIPSTSTTGDQQTLEGPASSLRSPSSYTMDDVYIWYEILFGDYGQELLKIYQNLGSSVIQISLGDLNDATDWDGWDFDNDNDTDKNNGTPCILRIDNDFKTAVHAAQALYTALLHPKSSSIFRDDIRLAGWNNALDAAISADGANEAQWRELATGQMRSIGATLQACYDAAIMGVSIANEGASWVLTIDAAKSEWTNGKRFVPILMIGAEIIPFISGRLIKSGKTLKRVINGQEFELTGEAVDVLGKISDELRIRKDALDALPPHARFIPDVRKQMAFITAGARIRIM